MPRLARFVLPGYFYHITQRGNNRQFLLKDNTDKRKYLYWFEEYREKYKVQIFAYCLMDNHVHFIARPLTDQALARLLNTVHMCYAQYYNKRIKGSGHVWQGRYYSCMLWEQHLRAAVRYVERNPVRAGLVKEPWGWPWSSAHEHVGKERGIIQLGDVREYIKIDHWKEYLDRTEESEMLKDIRDNTRSGRVWGPQDYIEVLEKKFGIVLKKPKMGRPKICKGEK